MVEQNIFQLSRFENTVRLLVYRYFDDMSQEEISELTGYSRKTVGKKLQKIREKVQGIATRENGGVR